MEKLFVFLFTSLMVVTSNFSTAQEVETVEVNEESADCPRYKYCQGENFPQLFSVNGRQVTCDVTPKPADRCCLTRSQHRVCYNIRVDGLHLNYAENNVFISTNFTGLCQDMVASQGLQLNRHTTATLGAEGGMVIWRDDRWQIVEKELDNEHIVTLACGYSN